MARYGHPTAGKTVYNVRKRFSIFQIFSDFKQNTLQNDCLEEVIIKKKTQLLMNSPPRIEG